MHILQVGGQLCAQCIQLISLIARLENRSFGMYAGIGGRTGHLSLDIEYTAGLLYVELLQHAVQVRFRHLEVCRKLAI